MDSMLIMYGCDMSKIFSGAEIKNYLDSLHHSQTCTHSYCKSDKVIGEAYVKSTNEEYVIYSCPVCGGTFYEQGTATALYIEKGRGHNANHSKM